MHPIKVSFLEPRKGWRRLDNDVGRKGKMENNWHSVLIHFGKDLLALWMHKHLEEKLFIKEYFYSSLAAEQGY